MFNVLTFTGVIFLVKQTLWKSIQFIENIRKIVLLDCGKSQHNFYKYFEKFSHPSNQEDRIYSLIQIGPELQLALRSFCMALLVSLLSE